MKKILLTLIAGSILATSAYALLPTLFPDTALLPRIPTSTGTIGNMMAKMLGTTDLGNYASDGTVSEAARLSGATASGYLHTTLDCPPTQVYGGIDAAGKAICRSQSLLLTQVGRIVNTSGTVMVYHASGSSTLVASLPYIIMNGDIIDTDPSGTADIIFSDDSLLTLADDTTLELRLTLGSMSEPIASVILASGNIWGRVLTATGVYNVGDGSMVAGVRGTSFLLDNSAETITGITWNSTTRTYDITRTGTPLDTRLTLVHTMLATPTIVTCHDGSTHALSPRQTMTGNLTTCSPPTTMSIGALYADTQIQNNTKRDIRYLQTLLTLSGSLMNISLHGGSPALAKITSELAATQPITSIEMTSLCANAGETWFHDFGCQPSSLVAIADYTRGDYNLYVRYGSGISTFIPVAPLLPLSFSGIVSTDYFANGARINTGQYIDYNVGSITGALLIPNLVGKRIGMWLKDPLVDTASARYFLSLGSFMPSYTKSDATGFRGLPLTSTSYSSDYRYIHTTGLNISAIGPTLRIGNRAGSTLPPNSHLSNTIEKVIIFE